MVNLAVPRKEAEDRLNDRVEEGKEILNLSIASEQDLDQAKRAFNKWSEYNARLLEFIFSDPSEAGKYRASASPAVGLPLAQQVELFRMSVSGRIEALESYVGQLELIPVADDARPLHGSLEEGQREREPQYGSSDSGSRKKVLRRVHERCRASQNYELSLEYHEIADNSQEGRAFVTLVKEGYIDAELKGASKMSTTFAFAIVRGLTREGKQELSRDVKAVPKGFSAAPNAAVNIPSSIQGSLRRFKEDHPDPQEVAFIMMQFGDEPPHDIIARAIKTELAEHGIKGLRADDKQYHEDLFPNVQTYMHGCGLGVAVFEHVEEEVFNPNVALEVGYMLALDKPICLLKEKRLTALHTDLASKLYRQFDAYDPTGTIPSQVSGWLSDNL